MSRVHSRFTRRSLAATAIVSVSLALAGCANGSSSDGTSSAAPDSSKLAKMTPVTLLLDYTVYGAHAGIFEAIDKGYYAADNIKLTVIQPSDPATALQLVQAGKADIGLATPADMITADTAKSKYTAFMSIIGGNLEGIAVKANSGITSAADLAGKKIGASGAQKGLVTAQITGAGGDPSKSEFIDTGMDFMQNLTAGTIDAAAVFLPDVAAAKVAGADIKFIPMGKGGGLAFPSLIAYTNQGTLKNKSAVIKAFSAATVHGYQDTIAHPKAAADTTAAQNEGVKAAGLEVEVETIKSDFQGTSPRYGYVNTKQLQALTDFLVKNGAVKDPPAATSFSTNAFLPADK